MDSDSEHAKRVRRAFEKSREANNYFEDVPTWDDLTTDMRCVLIHFFGEGIKHGIDRLAESVAASHCPAETFSNRPTP
jgi:hypothetical protein